MPALLTFRGRIAILLAVLMLAVAALALVVIHQQLYPPQQPTWDDALLALLSDPLLGGAGIVADPPAAGGPLGGDGLALLGAWLLLVPIAARVAWLAAGHLARPLLSIAEAAEAAGPANIAARVPMVGPRDDEGRRLGAAFNRLMDRFEEHEAERRRLVDDAAHEVRNPLTVMRTSLDVALGDPADTVALRAAAEVSQRAGERIARTVDGLQDAFRDAAPRARRGPVDLATIVNELAHDYGEVAARRSITIERRAPAGLDLIADRDALRRAVENLLVNALRYAPPGSPVVLGAGAVPGWRWVGVRDFGPGIGPEDQPLVFAHGWRGSGPGTEGGSGIGLALVRQIAEAHGGTVRLSSVERGGSSFVVWLPASGPDGSERARIDSLSDPLWWPAGPASPPAPSTPFPPHLAPAPSAARA